MVSMLVSLYKKMYLIRKSEEVIIDNYFDDEMKTPMHMSKGGEHISVGVIGALNDDDQIFTTYRSHAPYLAKTGDTDKFFAEMYGKETGESKGKAGSMHIACPEKGYMSSSAIVASNISVAVGAAFANKQLGNDRVVVVFFGDGAVDEGNFWESINMAALWQLPILFIYEDNDLAVFTTKRDRHGYSDYDIDGIVDHFRINVEGYISKRVDEVYGVAKEAIDKMRLSKSPYFLSFCYCRHLEHVGVCEDRKEEFRSEDGREDWDDPLERSRGALARSHPYLDINKLEKDVDEQVYKSLEFAKQSKFSDVNELRKDVFCE